LALASVQHLEARINFLRSAKPAPQLISPEIFTIRLSSKQLPGYLALLRRRGSAPVADLRLRISLPQIRAQACEAPALGSIQSI
jgi:hypothetical protein